MEIELKSVKIHKGLSEETYCYTATVLVDGVPAFHASNHGHGGADMYHPVKGYNGPSEIEINAWLKANKEPCVSHGVTMEYDLELMVGELLDDHERRKTLSRMLKTKIVVMVEHKGEDALASYPARLKPTPENIARIAAKGDRVVNGNAELETRALALV